MVWKLQLQFCLKKNWWDILTIFGCCRDELPRGRHCSDTCHIGWCVRCISSFRELCHLRNFLLLFVFSFSFERSKHHLLSSVRDISNMKSLLTFNFYTANITILGDDSWQLVWAQYYYFKVNFSCKHMADTLAYSWYSCLCKYFYIFHILSHYCNILEAQKICEK